MNEHNQHSAGDWSDGSAISRWTELLVKELRDYAAGRASDVAREAETPRLAGLLLQQYGLGMASAVSYMSGPRSADLITEVLDEETAKIDPKWQQHNRERWSDRPADIAIK